MPRLTDCNTSPVKPLGSAASLQMYLSIIFDIRITLFYSAVLQHTCQSCSSTDGQQLSTELILHKTQMPSTPYLIRSVYVCSIFRAFSIINFPSYYKIQHSVLGARVDPPCMHYTQGYIVYLAWVIFVSTPLSEIPGGSIYSKSCGEDFAHVKAQLTATR